MSGDEDSVGSFSLSFDCLVSLIGVVGLSASFVASGVCGFASDAAGRGCTAGRVGQRAKAAEAARARGGSAGVGSCCAARAVCAAGAVGGAVAVRVRPQRRPQRPSVTLLFPLHVKKGK